MIIPVLEGLTLTKGHVGSSDAIIVPDLTASRTITPTDIHTICDRVRGIGADYLIRVVNAGDGAWRLDAWDSDGAPATGNSSLLRLAAHYLRVSGLVDLADGESVVFVSEDGEQYVSRTGLRYSTVIPPATPLSKEAVERGFDVAVMLDGVSGARGGMRGGLTIMSQNPSVVVAVEHEDELNSATGKGKADPEIPGADLVLVVPLGDTTIIDFDGVERPVTQFRARTFMDGREVASEKGLRDAAIALHAWAGDTASGIYYAHGFGLDMEIRFAGDGIEMTGPAEIVAEFNLAGIVGEGR